MRFLLRTALWLGVAAIVLPALFRAPDGGTAGVSAVDAMTAASATIADLRQFCTRQPDACAVGAQVGAVAIGAATAGVKMLYESLAQQTAGNGPSGSTTQPAVPPAGAVAAAGERPDIARPTTSQHTLTAADISPEWRSPGRREPIPMRRPPG